MARVSLVLLPLFFAGAVLAGPISGTLPTTASKPAPRTSSAPSVARTSNKSDWSKLTPAQQTALAPLAADWNKLDPFHQDKWLELSNKFAAMSPADQARMQERMRAWAKLTPEQRRLARERYLRAKKLDAEQKSRQWEQYQQLPEEKKKELAASLPPKKQIANPPRPRSASSARTTKHVPAKQPVPTAEAIQPSIQTSPVAIPSPPTTP